MHVVQLDNSKTIIIVERSDVTVAKDFDLIDIRDIRDVANASGIKESFLRVCGRADYVFLADGFKLRVLKARYPITA